MAIVKVTDSDFDTKIESGVKLVDFWATWCGPCKMIAPVLEELAGDYDGKADILKLDVDENPSTAAKYEVMSIPTLIVFKDGLKTGAFHYVNAPALFCLRTEIKT